MTELKNIVAYILKKYPHKDELSNARVTKMVYLADWYSVLNFDKQLSNIEWYFDNYGPFVWDIKKCVEANPQLFSATETSNMFGSRKIMFEIKDNTVEPELDEQAKLIINHVINNTKTMTWEDFIKLIYSTYPIVSSTRYTTLDLRTKAKEYKHSN